MPHYSNSGYCWCPSQPALYPAGRSWKEVPKGWLIKGCYHAIGKPNGTLCVCEGYATGASIHEATGYAVAVAFNAGNLGPVARALREKYPKIRLVICADDDQWTKGNPGVTKATEAARAVGAEIAIPRFKNLSEKPTYFNDLARLEERKAVQNAIQNASPPTASTLSVLNGEHFENFRTDAEEAWPQPQPIVADLLPVEPLPVTIIPEPYRAWIADVSERMQTPPDFLWPLPLW
jgi:putative DNA primase/helicase